MSAHSSTPSQPAMYGGGDASKRSVDDAALDPASQQTAKRKRPQSCDTCRSRKIKCVRLQVDGLDASADNRCVQCRAIDAKCTFDYIPKRPGPQSSFAKTARREAEAQAKAAAQSHLHQQAAGPSPHSRTPASAFVDTPSTHIGGPSPHPQQSASTHSPADDSWYRALAAQNFASGSGAHGTQTRSSSWSGGANFDAYLNHSMLAMTPSHFAGMSAASPFDFSPHNMANLSGPSPSMSISNASSATSGSYAGSSSWHASARSEAGSAAPLASLAQTQPPAHQRHQPSTHAAPSIVDHMHSFEVAAGPLPIPFFSRVQSPVSSSARLPQVNEHSAPPTRQQHGIPFSSSSDIDTPACIITPSTSFNTKAKSGPSLSNMECGPVLRPRSLDDIAPRQTFLAIVSLYFHYLWPLLPIVDRPTFSHDLLNRRDERDQAFFAFVLSLTSYTLIQCPRTVIPAPWTVYRRLHRICHLTSRRMQPRVYDPPQLLHVNTLYCDHIYLGTVGKTNASNAVLAEAVRVAYTLGLHDERKNDARRGVAPYSLDAASFANYRAPTANAVENELRRRMFWVLHGSSTTIAMLKDEPALIHAIDACVDLPMAVDEEALTNPGHVQRSPSVLCGFLTVTRLHQAMLELLESYRRDRRFPIDDLEVARSRIRYLADVLRRLQQALDDMPEELRNPTYTHSPPERIRRPGSALPALETVASRGVQQQQHAPLLQAIGFDAATQTALGNHLSGTSPWPWPAETFSREGLPNAEARSSNEASATRSPRADGADGGSDAPRGRGDVEGGQPPHQVLTPPPAVATLTPRHSSDPSASGAVNMVDFINVFRPSPPPPSSTTPVLSPMCTMHANIVTTESLVRFMVTEYREMVGVRIHDLKLRQPSAHTSGTSAEDVPGESWQEAAANLLRVFNSLPLDALASNGQSLIDKIMYVVSALLNRTGKQRGLTGTGGFGYMSSLLAMLTRLSQTRRDDSASEWEEDELLAANASGEAQGGGGEPDSRDRGGSAGNAGGGRGDGRTHGHHGEGNSHNGDDRSGSDRRDLGRRNPDSHSDGLAKQHHNHHLQPASDPLTSFPFNTSAPSSSAASTATGAATDSNTSSTVNTASTTPTSEHPSSAFYDKILIRSTAAPSGNGAAQTPFHQQQQQQQHQTQDKSHPHDFAAQSPASPANAPRAAVGSGAGQMDNVRSSTSVAQHS
ncbi:hypothetical protein EX895_003140 [Sporisorium graminicola]|uniref:Zn(2)-C6 fungal-type domain-containing protein n=1 Tax=Sporisorium graminicola TaxID=280036 RepID=A0A4U7KTX5_9BASI|nr:hypothetical protein EX895_003140 [Sporisorium graminicola]TKY88044.1 hypothetical protein EX895_003140 [Sporisorium graminicola]